MFFLHIIDDRLPHIALHVMSIFQSGMRVSNYNQFSVQLFAHQAGQANVKLEVSPTFPTVPMFLEMASH